MKKGCLYLLQGLLQFFPLNSREPKFTPCFKQNNALVFSLVFRLPSTAAKTNTKFTTKRFSGRFSQLLCYTFIVSILLASIKVESATQDNVWTWKQIREKAIENNPSLKAKRLQARAQQKVIDSRYGEYLPQLNAIATKVDEKQKSDRLELEEDAESYGLEINWNLFNGLQSYSGLRQSQAQYRVKQAEVLEEQVLLRDQLRRAYFSFLVANRRLRLAEKIALRLAENAQFIDLKYKSGAEASWAANESRAKARQAEIKKNIELNNQIKAQNTLIELMGLTSLEDLRQTNRLHQSNRLRPDKPISSFQVSDQLDSLLEQKIEKPKLPKDHPRLMGLEQEILAQEWTTKQVRGEYLPRIDLNYSVKNEKLNDLDPVDVTQVGIQATWNLFEGFTTRNDLQRSRVIEESLKAQKLALSRQLQREIENTLLNLKNAKEQLPIARDLLQSAHSRVKVVSDQYRLGSRSFLDWERAQTNLLEIEQDEISVIEEVLKYKAEVERLAGLTLEDQ